MIKLFAAVSLLIALPAAANAHPEKTPADQGSTMGSMEYGAMMKAMSDCKATAGMTHDQVMKMGHDQMMKAMQECQRDNSGADAHAGHAASSSAPKAEPQTSHQH